MKYAVLALVLLLFLPAVTAQIDLSQPWQFSTGDNPAWADPAFDDRGWTAVQPSTYWETQGFPDYNGFGWYRLRFFLPSGLRASAVLQDSVRILLGKIDDCDALYLNGQKIGQTGAFPEDPGGYATAWQVSRRYALPVGHPALRWDAENVPALRVYDGGGPGGFFDKREMSLAMVDLIDFVTLYAQRQLQRKTLGPHPPGRPGGALYPHPARIAADAHSQRGRVRRPPRRTLPLCHRRQR